MVNKILAAALIGTAAIAAPAAAQDREVEYPKGSLGYGAILAEDYAKAERQLKDNDMVRHDDPARLINYGLVLAKTGRVAEARKLFEQAIAEDEVELVLSDGRIMGSRDAALRALESLQERYALKR